MTNERDIHARIPEEMTVRELNEAVRALRECLYQEKLKSQGAFAAGVEAAARIFDSQAISARCYGLDATKHEWMAAHIRALAAPVEAHGDAFPSTCPSCKRTDSIRIDGRGAWLCAACGRNSLEDEPVREPPPEGPYVPCPENCIENGYPVQHCPVHGEPPPERCAECHGTGEVRDFGSAVVECSACGRRGSK